MVLHRHSSIEVGAECQMRVVQGKLLPLSLFHYSYTPIYVGGKAIVQVVHDVLCNVSPCIKRLVADKHSAPETPPVEMLGRCQTAAVEECSLVIDYIGVSIYDTG